MSVDLVRIRVRRKYLTDLIQDRARILQEAKNELTAEQLFCPHINLWSYSDPDEMGCRCLDCGKDNVFPPNPGTYKLHKDGRLL